MRIIIITGLLTALTACGSGADLTVRDTPQVQSPSGGAARLVAPAMMPGAVGSDVVEIDAAPAPVMTDAAVDETAARASQSVRVISRLF